MTPFRTAASAPASLQGLAGAVSAPAANPRRDEMRDFLLTERDFEKIRALNEIAAGRGQTLAQLALAWVLRDERVTSALIGASSVAQLEENVGALRNLALSDDELAEIDRHATEAGINIWEASSRE